MSKLCCVGLSLASRIIGTYTMSISVLIINVFMSNYFSKATDEDFFDSVGCWTLLGLNWMHVLKTSQLERKAETAVVFLLIYTISFLLASAYLTLGSISGRPKCAVPWMYLQMISIIDQSVALSVHLMHDRQYDVYDKSIWYIPVSSIYLMFSAYLWIIVLSARKKWLMESDSTDLPVQEIETATQLDNGNAQKSPSFLSQNFSTYELSRFHTMFPSS